MFNSKARKRLAILGALLCLATTATSQEQGDGQIILRDPAETAPNKPPETWLIPKRLLETPFDQWSSEDRNRAPRQTFERFNGLLERARAINWNGECTPGEGIVGIARASMIPSGARFSILEIAGTTKNILLGEVIATEPAWNASTEQIATLVTLKVQKVVRGIEPVEVGDIVTYRRPWGSLTVKGITLCSYSSRNPPDPERPARTVPERQRQIILLLGNFVPGNKSFMNSGGFEEFQVIDGFVHYPLGFSYYKDKKPENLDLLLSELQGSSQ